MAEPKSPFLPTPEERDELDRKDGFDRHPPKPEVEEPTQSEVNVTDTSIQDDSPTEE